MPITLNCTCGKPLRVADEHAGKQVKCPACNAILTAERPKEPAESAGSGEFDDFEVLEETVVEETTPTPPQPIPLPPEPAAQPAAPSRPRLKATVAEELEPQAPPAAPAEKPKKRKKKKKVKTASGEDGDDDWYERMRENEAWMRRVLRGSAFIVLGVLILAGVAIIYFGYREDVKWLQETGGKGILGLILLTVFGLAAVVKGVIGLFFGQFLGEDD
jgi:hypothetical protein